MPSTAQTILGSTAHPSGGTTATVYGNKFKADGYYGFTDGLHTAAFYLSAFVGQVGVQGTLAKDPGDNDWANLTLSGPTTDYNDSTGGTTRVIAYNFTGNFTYIRAWAEFDSTDTSGTGAISKVLYNY
jgi:hypothetical protein